MIKPCGRCGNHRNQIQALGYSMYCSNCGGIGVVTQDGDPIIVPESVVEAGCKALHDQIAESYEPEYKLLIARMYVLMKAEAERLPAANAAIIAANELEDRLWAVFDEAKIMMEGEPIAGYQRWEEFKQAVAAIEV